jgi:quinol-cytochrome oxidoreductase complex cytochrome b subunit
VEGPALGRLFLLFRRHHLRPFRHSPRHGTHSCLPYVPTEGGAYRSIVTLVDDVPFGGLLRGIHSWAGDLIVVALLIHMGRVFLTGAFKNPRELNWIVGVTR